MPYTVLLLEDAVKDGYRSGLQSLSKVGFRKG
jgi:hypothetical protein